jgi:hypothetical protein
VHSAILVCHDVDTEGTKNVDGSRGSTEGKEKKVDGSGVRVMYMYMYVCMYVYNIYIDQLIQREPCCLKNVITNQQQGSTVYATDDSGRLTGLTQHRTI